MNSIPFQFDTKYGQFSDALILSDEELATLSESDINLMKEQQLANWIAFVESPKPSVETITESVETPLE